MGDGDASFLHKVYLSADVYAMCLNHAFTTEKEEVMGLLIGEVQEGISIISAGLMLHRSDKQPDRVEISPEQLCTASLHAEQLAHQLDRPMRVLGWYHSHPHITIWPSHVDVRTQSMYQTMDPLFVGLIFSVYCKNGEANLVQLTAFQAVSSNGNLVQREIEIIIKNSPLELYNLESMAKLPKILVQEELANHNTEDQETNDELANLHNDSFITLALVHIVSKVTRPICDDLEGRLNATKNRIKVLEKMRERLLKGEE